MQGCYELPLGLTRGRGRQGRRQHCRIPATAAAGLGCGVDWRLGKGRWASWAAAGPSSQAGAGERKGEREDGPGELGTRGSIFICILFLFLFLN